MCDQSFSSLGRLRRHTNKQKALHTAVKRTEKNGIVYVCGVCAKEYSLPTSFYSHRWSTGHGLEATKQIAHAPYFDEGRASKPVVASSLKRKAVPALDVSIKSEEDGDLPAAPPPSKKRDQGYAGHRTTNELLTTLHTTEKAIADDPAPVQKVLPSRNADNVAILCTTLSIGRVQEEMNCAFMNIHTDMLPIYASVVGQEEATSRIRKVLAPLASAMFGTLMCDGFHIANALKHDLETL